MVSLLILGVVVGWVVLWVYVFKHARNKAERVVAVLVAVLVPFWDLPVGYLQFASHCSADGGLHVYGSLAPQDRVYFATEPFSSVDELLNQGFKVVEIVQANGKGVVRHELQRGQLTSHTREAPESAIAVSMTLNEKLPWNIYRDQYLAHTLPAHKVIATYTRFSWHGGWIQRAMLIRTSVDCFFQRGNPLITLLRQGS